MPVKAPSFRYTGNIEVTAFRLTLCRVEIAQKREIALWRAKGEFWGISSPFAFRAAVGDTPKGRGSRAGKIGRPGSP